MHQNTFKQDNPDKKITIESKTIDTGLNCLVIIAGINGINVDPAQIKHTFAIPEKGMNTTDILIAAKEIGLKAKLINVHYNKLLKLRLPVIAVTNNGKYIVIAQADQEKLLILDPLESKPKLIRREELEKNWTNQLILCIYGNKSKSIQHFGLKWFIPTVIKYKRTLIEVLMASFIVQLFALVTPIFTQVIIDKVLVHNGITTLDVLVLGLILVAIFEAILNISRTYVFSHTTSKIDVILGTRLFKHLFSLPLAYFETRRVGDTIARVRELETIRSFLTGQPLTVVLDLMFIFVFLAVMFFYSTTLTLVTLAAIPFFIALSLLVLPVLRQRINNKFMSGANSQSYLVEAVSGVQTIKSFALEPEIHKKWGLLLANYIKDSLKTTNLGGAAGGVGQFIQKISTLAILWFGARLVMNGELTVGQLIAFQMLSGRVSGPILRLVQMWQDFQQIGISIERLGDIFNSIPEPGPDSSKVRLPAIRGNLRFEGVRFRYRINGSEVIRNMSFEIPPGMTVGIVGRSGSGKSTLSKLIQRLYIPEGGRILIDGIDIAMADPAWLRRQIGVVLQENFLFNVSVRDNIAIHHPSANMTDIVRVAQLAGAHDFILELPEGYDTNVGEKGTVLSGGQKQRVAIARALLSNPRLLIFDEATSALDYESERIIQDNLENICEGRTVLIIAHRLSTLRTAHKIMVIDRGELIEFGTHDELISRHGLYHYLYMQQERGSVVSC